MVLLHGLGGDGSRWDANNIESLLQADFHVIALDQIGFGQSDKPLANFTTLACCQIFLVRIPESCRHIQGIARWQFDGCERCGLYCRALPGCG